MRLMNGLKSWLAVVALVAAPLMFPATTQAESGCHRTGTPTPPPATSSRNG